MAVKIQIKYHVPQDELTFIEGKSDWIDLRASKDYVLKKGDFELINLGVSMRLPEEYEAHVAPRSSTFKRWGLIQTNGTGVIDESYCSDSDVWMMPVLATRDTQILKGDRVCQFRIMKKQSGIEFEEVDNLGGEARGGFGSTGAQ